MEIFVNVTTKTSMLTIFPENASVAAQSIVEVPRDKILEKRIRFVPKHRI